MMIRKTGLRYKYVIQVHQNEPHERTDLWNQSIWIHHQYASHLAANRQRAEVYGYQWERILRLTYVHAELMEIFLYPVE